MDKKLIVAHRGASKLAPENTLEAFAKAIELGADMIELDVRMSGDGQLVVVHNATLGGHFIKNLNLREIKSLSNNHIPTLEETLELIAGKIKLNAELKENGYEQLVGDVLLKYLQPSEILVSSFSAKAVTKFKQLFPNIQVGLIVGVHYKDIGKVIKLIFSKSFAGNFDALIINKFLWEFGIVNLFKYTNRPYFPWTTDDPEQIKNYLLNNRLAGVFTNKPDLAIKIRSQL